MAIWQYKLSLVLEKDLLLRYHRIPDQLSESEFLEFEMNSEELYRKAELLAEKVLPKMESWSDEALMYGSDRSNKIEIWPEWVHVRIDCRKLDSSILKKYCEIAQELKCFFHDDRGGTIFRPNYEELKSHVLGSVAYKYVRDPESALYEIRKTAQEKKNLN